MEWQRYGYRCDERDHGYFYTVLTKRPDGSLKHEPHVMPEQGPFRSEDEAMYHLQQWINGQAEVTGTLPSFDDVEFDNPRDHRDKAECPVCYYGDNEPDSRCTCEAPATKEGA